MAVRTYGINHVAIEVSDIERAIAFYTDVFNLEKLNPRFRCDFRDPWGNHIQVVDLHDESLVWLLPYLEVQEAGVTFQKEDVGRAARPRR